MYEFEAVRPAFDRLWSALAQAFREQGLARVPGQLERTLAPDELWTHPDLLFAQTCGYPFTHALAGRVQLVATPCYGAPFCAGPRYASLIMARADDGRRRLADFCAGLRLAINDRASHSGHHALRAALVLDRAGGRTIGGTVVTGSHMASLAALRDGRADLAAIDCVSAALFERHAPGYLESLRTIAVSPSAPALPFITSLGTGLADLERLRAGLRAVLRDPSLEAVRRDLLIEDVRVLSPEAYRRIVELERLGALVDVGPADESL